MLSNFGPRVDFRPIVRAVRPPKGPLPAYLTSPTRPIVNLVPLFPFAKKYNKNANIV